MSQRVPRRYKRGDTMNKLTIMAASLPTALPLEHIEASSIAGFDGLGLRLYRSPAFPRLADLARRRTPQARRQTRADGLRTGDERNPELLLVAGHGFLRH